MEKKELQEILGQTYKQENWKQIIQFVFPNVSILATPKEFPIKNDKIKSFKQLGSVHLNDGKNLALFELLLYDSVNIHRNRVELNNEISKYIDQEQIHGVLSVFEQGTEDYRFTFSARSTEFDEDKSDFVQRKTDTKRFTYVLGKNESCKTPAERFYNLSQLKYEIDIELIQNAFSVEQLSKEFFDKYKKQFEKFYTYIVNNEAYSEISFGDEREKGIRDFVKQLLGRIVFLYFLQKKGWMGCKAHTKSWEDGDKQFMQSLFENFSNPSEFNSKCLSELFHNTLNKKRDEDIFLCIGLKGALNKSKVPYLNGGLFDSDEGLTRKIDFPSSYFQELLDFFSQYNFTIDENDPNDHEVGIAPEMLGHIFENLLEDNKDKGAYYTPKEIVHFMCQESLIEYLCTTLQIEPEDKERVAVSKLLKQKVVEEILIPELKNINAALDNVKICDPAIGSGAFPMGLLQEIFFTKQTLWNFEYGNLNDFPSSVIKSNIIQNSIYGVDIEKGAVDVARLRFWLSLIVDEEVPKSLPNLDFKIVVGNSLVSLFENEIIEIDWDIKIKNVDSVKNLIIDQQNKLHQLEHLQHLYFQSFTNKDVLSKDIKNLKVDILTNQLNLTKFYFVENNPILGGFMPSDIENKKNELNKIYINKIDSILDNLDLIKHNENGKLNYFDWKLNFPEIFNDKITENIGFDILIANPPYLKERDNAHIFNAVNNSRLGKSYHQGKMDFWYYFLHLSIDITSPKSVISFITSRYWINSQGAKKLIQRVNEKLSFASVVDIGKLKVFDNVAGHHLIHTYSKCKKEYFIYKQLSNDIKSIESESDNQNVTITNLSNNDVFTDNEIIFASQELKSSFTTTLGDKYNLGQGIVEASDKVSSKQFKKVGRTDFLVGDGVFVLSKSELSKLKLNDEEQKLIGKYIDPLNVKSYSIEVKQEKFIIYSDKYNKNLIENDRRFLNLKSHLDFYSDFITSSNSPYGLHRPRELELFKSKKILFKGMFVKNECAIDNNGYFVGMSFISIIEKEKKEGFSLEFLLGVLNSNYALNWFYTYGKKRGAGVDIGVDKLRTFPISNTPSRIIETIVKDIIAKKEFNKDTTELEKNLDNLVYKLYNLKYEEIKTLDPDFSLSKIDYESLECL